MQNAKHAFSATAVTTPREEFSYARNASQNEEMLAFISETPQDDGFFFYPFSPLLPFLAAREHVSRYDVLMPGYSLSSQYREACQSVQKQARWVVIDRSWMDAKFVRVFPSMKNPSPPERILFEQFLQSKFAVVARFGKMEIRQRNDSFGGFSCTKITL